MQRGCSGNGMSEDTVPGSKTVTRKKPLQIKEEALMFFPQPGGMKCSPKTRINFFQKLLEVNHE